jgi:hypothetical protein
MFIDNSAKLTKLKAKITRNSWNRDTKEAKSIISIYFIIFRWYLTRYNGGMSNVDKSRTRKKGESIIVRDCHLSLMLYLGKAQLV